jgi:hypothetical protein
MCVKERPNKKIPGLLVYIDKSIGYVIGGKYSISICFKHIDISSNFFAG